MGDWIFLFNCSLECKLVFSHVILLSLFILSIPLFQTTWKNFSSFHPYRIQTYLFHWCKFLSYFHHSKRKECCSKTYFVIRYTQPLRIIFPNLNSEFGNNYEYLASYTNVLWPNHAFMQSKKNNRSIKLSITEFQSSCSRQNRTSISPNETSKYIYEHLALYTWFGFCMVHNFGMEQLSYFCCMGCSVPMLLCVWPNSHTNNNFDLLQGRNILNISSTIYGKWICPKITLLSNIYLDIWYKSASCMKRSNS